MIIEIIIGIILIVFGVCLTLDSYRFRIDKTDCCISTPNVPQENIYKEISRLERDINSILDYLEIHREGEINGEYLGWGCPIEHAVEYRLVKNKKK